jgi:hypothetical protein
MLLLLAAPMVASPGSLVGQQKESGKPSDQIPSKEVAAPPGTGSDRRTGLLRMANGITNDGFVFSRNTYRGADGENVYFEVFRYRSTERAKKAFDAQMKNAPRVIEHRMELDENGDFKAEMAVIPVTIDGKKPSAMIVIVSGATSRDVRSDSMEDVLAVARTLKP